MINNNHDLFYQPLVMALDLKKACRDKNVDCIVAPYEADSQLAFLSLRG